MFFNLSTIYTCMNIYTRAWILEVNPKELRWWLTCFFTILLILTSLLRYSSKKRLEHEMFTSLHPLQRCQNFSLATSASVILWYTALWGVFCLPSSLTLISAFLLSSSSRGSLFFHYAGMSTGFCLMHLLYLSQHLPEYHFARVCHQLLWHLECETPHIDVRISLQPHYHES